MIELAGHILKTKAAHFDPSKFKDEYENALKALVKRKAAGKPIKTAERAEKPDNVISLMDALKQSLKGKAIGQARGTCAVPAAGASASGEEGASIGGKGAQGGVTIDRANLRHKTRHSGADAPSLARARNRYPVVSKIPRCATRTSGAMDSGPARMTR